MPWDSIDRWRDEDATEKRKVARRGWLKIGGRRSIDNQHLIRFGRRKKVRDGGS